MSKGLEQGMVLVMSLWDDHNSNMLWLDSNYPTNAMPLTLALLAALAVLILVPLTMLSLTLLRLQ